jgi:membrane protein required for beta-lactamase induction
MSELERQGSRLPAEQTSIPAIPEPQKTTPLASERVIINAPMSFAGAAQRTMRMTESMGPVKWAMVPWLLILWWFAVLCWYIVFGIFLIPYRLLRRGARKRKAEALRHREMLGAIDHSAPERTETP